MAALAPYVPPAAARLLGAGPLVPTIRAAEAGALLVADLVGFTALAEAEADRGPAGVERLQQRLDRVFAVLVGAIGDAGGEVIGYAGDATLAWWPASATQPLASVVARAVATGLALHGRVADVARTLGAPLALRVRIAAGEGWHCVTGGVAGRWVLLQGGPPFADGADVAVPPGSVFVAASAWPFVREAATARALAGGALVTALPVGTPAGGAGDAGPAPVPTPSEALLGFVPQTVRDRIATVGAEWLAERRQVTTLFLTVDPLGDAPPAAARLERWHEVVPTVQRALDQAGGSLLQALVDDTGRFVVVAAWGVPGAAHADGAERALGAAHALEAALVAEGLTPSIGIATGRVFCGRRGAGPRVEYAVIGRAVNRAARLMRAAGGAIWCDEETAADVRRIALVPVGAVALKGMGTVAVHSPRRLASREVETRARPTPAALSGVSDGLLGRAAETDALVALVETLRSAPHRTVTAVVEGEPGIGKSRLRQAVTARLDAAGIPHVTATCDALDGQTAYRPLRRAVRMLLDLPEELADGAPPAALVEAAGPAADRLPLLAPVLGVAWADTPLTAAMSGRARAEGAAQLLAALLARRAPVTPRVLLLEDAHWMDAASWALVADALAGAPGLALLAFARPLEQVPLPPRAMTLLDGAAIRLRLRPLTPEDVARLAAATLGARDVPAPLTRALVDRTDGNPLFVQQAIGALADRGIVWREGEAVHYDAAALAREPLPDSVHGAIVARFDRLASAEQVLLQVASVIGREFDGELLARLVPAEVRATDVPRHLAVLGARTLMEAAGDGRWRFVHAIVRDAAYELLPLQRRRALHAAVAALLEATGASDPGSWGRLAWHWTEAHDPVRAPAALERAGDAALRAGAYEEARALFARLLDLERRGFDDAGGTPLVVADDVRARWWGKRGLAEYDLGHLEESRHAFEAALAADGDPVPPEGGAMRLRLAREALRQLAGRPDARHDEAQARRIAQVLNTLGRIHHLAQRPDATLYTILRRYNVMRGRAPSPELMTSLSGMAYLLPLLGRAQAGRALEARIRTLHATLGEPLEYADALYPVTVSQLGHGRWDDCARDAGEALAIFTRLGERKGRMAVLAVLANLEELRGDFARSTAQYEELAALAAEAADQVSALWAAGGLAMLAYRRGALEEAMQHAEHAHALSTRAGESVSVLSMDGIMAMAALRRGDAARARAVLRDALPRLERTPRFQTAHHTVNGFDMLAEACLTLWALDGPEGRARWEAGAARAVGRLSAYARTFPIGRAIACTWRGTLAARRGRLRAAQREWRAGLVHAEAVPIPFNTARLHAEIAAHAPPGSDDRRRHLAEARSRFAALGAEAEVARLSRLDAPPAGAAAPSASAPAA